MKTYTVVKGDTLIKIARAHGTTWQALASTNKIGPPYLLRVGQQILIPVDADPIPTAGLIMVRTPTNHKWPRREPVRWIIMHDPVGGSETQTLRYLIQNDRGVSYNEMLIGPKSSGTVYGPTTYVLAEPEYYVGHAGYSRLPDGTNGPACNRAAWGLCIYKHKNDNGPFPPELYDAAVNLAARRCREFGVNSTRVLAHREVDPGRRSDPRGLNMLAFRIHVQRVLDGRA